MIPEIKKILYTTDLSENARHAFGYAASIANRYGAGITILHVLWHSPSADSLVMNMMGEERWNDLRKANEQEVVDTLKSRLEKFCEDVSKELPSCPFITDQILVRVGNPVDEIIEEAEKGGHDMVVMGAHGLGIIGSAMMGVNLHCDKNVGPEASHESWMAQKVAEGWVYGPVKDPEAKTHHCIVPFDMLPREQQAKDFIFRAVVHALRDIQKSTGDAA